MAAGCGWQRGGRGSRAFLCCPCLACSKWTHPRSLAQYHWSSDEELARRLHEQFNSSVPYRDPNTAGSGGAPVVSAVEAKKAYNCPQCHMRCKVRTCLFALLLLCVCVCVRARLVACIVPGPVGKRGLRFCASLPFGLPLIT